MAIAEKIIRVYSTTSEALNLINEPTLRAEFEANENIIAIILKIDETLNENVIDVIRSMSLDLTRPLLIAFESTVDGKLIVYWRTKDMNHLLKVVLERIKDGNKLLNVPSDFLIDSLLLKCIKLDDNGLSPTDEPSKYTHSPVPIDCLYNSNGCNLLMMSLNENNQKSLEYFSKNISDLNFCPDKRHEQSLRRRNVIQTLAISYRSNPGAFMLEMEENTSYEKIIIEDCPSASEALKMIENSGFRSEFVANANAIAIVLRIGNILNEDEINKVHSLNLEAPNSRPFLIAFESTVNGEMIVYWRTKDMNELLSTRLERIEIRKNLFFPVHTAVSTLLIDSFLLPSIQCEHNCLINNEETEHLRNAFIPYYYLYNHERLNPLMVAVAENDEVSVDYFLKTKIDVNYSFEVRVGRDQMLISAAYFAEENKNLSILFKLLKNNSRYPSNFELNSTSSEIKNLLEEAFKFHKFIEAGNARECEQFIKNNSGMGYFFDTQNNSAAIVALKRKNIVIYELLAKNSIHVAPHEELSSVLRDNRFCRKVKAINDTYKLNLGNWELFTLLSKTKTSLDNTNISDPLGPIEKAYRYLLDIPEVKILLELVVAHDKFTVIPDFNRDSVQLICAMPHSDAEAIFFPHSGKICFGAKNIKSKKHLVYGVIIHEFGHNGMHLVFRNDCKPYSFGDKIAEEKFNEIVENIQQKVGRGEDIDGIVKVVFSYDDELCFTPEEFTAELIARVPQLIVAYRNNPRLLEKCKEELKDLFDFYMLEVQPKLHEALPFIKILSDEKNIIKWNDLPASLRITCMNKKLIRFQGEFVSLFDIAGCHESTIFYCLSSHAIRDLIEDKHIEIGKEIEEIEVYAERKMIKNNANEEEIALDPLELASTERLVFLSDQAGTGKTTTFKYLAKKIKKKYPNNWVLYVDLKKYLNIYEQFKGNSLNAWDLIIEILKLEGWNRIVFHDLFDSGRVIVFWDGLDEISPNYKELMTEVVKDFNESSSNRQWISDRSQFIDHFEEIFQVSAYKLVSYSKEDRLKYFENYFQVQNLEPSKFDDIIVKIQEFIESIECNNPLLIKMLTDICFQPNFNFNLLSNQFSIFAQFIDMKLEVVRKKGEIVQNDIFKTFKHGEFMRVHQKFALKSVFGEHFDDFSLKFPISAPNLVNRKSATSYDEISRFGILQLADGENFKFVQENFADYFVAQYLIDNLYYLEHDDLPQDEEIVKRLKLLFHIIFDERERFKVIRKLIKDYIDSRETYASSENINSSCWCERELIQSEFKHLALLFFKSIEKLNFSEISFACKFFANNKKMLDFFWNSNESETLFVKIAKNYDNSEHAQQLLEIVGRYFQNKEREHVLYGSNQRGNILYNICQKRKLIFANNSKLKSSYFYADRYNSDSLLPEIPKLGDSFLDFLSLVEKDLTVEEMKEIFIRNPSSIFSRNNKSFKYLTTIWSKAEFFLREKREIKKMLLTIDVQSNRYSVLTEGLQIWNESWITLILSNYKKCFKNKEEILDFILLLNKHFETNVMRFTIENPNFKVCEVFLKFIEDVGFNAEEQKSLLENVGCSGQHALTASMQIQNEGTFEIMKAYMQALYTKNQIQCILWDERENLIHNMFDSSSIDVCQSAYEFILELFPNHRDILREFINNFYYQGFDAHKLIKLSFIATHSNLSLEELTDPLSEIFENLHKLAESEAFTICNFIDKTDLIQSNEDKFKLFDSLAYFLTNPSQFNNNRRLFRNENQSKFIIHAIWRNVHENSSFWTFLFNSKILQHSHPQLQLKIHEIHECKNEEEIEEFIGKNLSQLTDEERKEIIFDRMLKMSFCGSDDFEYCSRYLRVNWREEFKNYLESKLSDLFGLVMLKDEKHLRVLIETFNVCFNNEELKILFIKNAQTSHKSIFCEYAEQSTERVFIIFWQFMKEFLLSADDRKQVLCQTWYNSLTPLYYSVRHNKDPKVFSLLKQLYFDHFINQEVQSIISKWKFGDYPILFDLIVERDLEFLNEFVSFFAKAFEENEEQLKCFVLTKNKYMNSIFQYFIEEEYTEKLELFTQFAKNSLVNLSKNDSSSDYLYFYPIEDDSE